jgi:outer membrane receptor protein involved in Fe transport
MSRTTTKRSFRAAIILGATCAALSAPVYAQSDGEETIEEIITTGSRIARTELESVSPITIVTEEAIEFAGANSIATILNELPSAGVPGSVDTATNFRTTTTGLNTIDLRNLGTNRALILVNGRRHVGGSAGSPTVDVSMIPVALVERVEVVTGGAAAAYGSEAIAGVINFIMKDDFEGIQLDARYGSSDGVDNGGADETDFSILAGGNFADDRGNAVVYLGYSDRGVLWSRDRDISANDAVNSSFGPKGVFFIPDDPGTEESDGYFATEGDGPFGEFTKVFNNAEDGFNRNQRRIIRVPSTRVQMNANITYELHEKANFFSEVSYNELESYSELEPIFAGQFISVGSLAPNINMPVNNPFMPDDLYDEIIRRDPDATEITMRRRMVELGGRTSDVQRRVFRAAVGLEGEISEKLDYEVYYQYGNFGQDQTNGGVFHTKNFYDALRAEPDGNGGYQCADSFARGLGCVPINVFGAGTITDEMLAWVGVDSQLTSRMNQEVFGASVSGYAFGMPAGDLGIAFGYEWREEESKFNSDSLAQSGLTSGNTTPNTVGEYDVSEFFVEALVPLLSGVPAAEYLGLELAYRVSDYSTIGSADAYKASLDWQPFDDLRLRGGVSTAVRAPNIGELFDPGSETFRNFVDPCALGGVGGPSATGNPNDVYETQTPDVQANCAQIPGSATLDPFALNIRSAGGLSAGNPNLEEESSDATTVGFVYTPSWVDGLSITLDYFEITVDKAINAFTAQTTADQCVRQPSFPSNPFCDLILRDPTTGLILRIDALAINVAEFEATGIDFNIFYGFEVGPGDLTLNLIGTHSMSNDFVPFEGGNIVDSQGEIGVPDWKANLNVTYLLDDWSFAWTTRYIDGVNIENDQLALGTISSYNYNDVQARYHFGDNNQYTAFVGIENVFDKKPPFLGQGIPGDVTGTNTAADVYDAIRRYWYFGFSAGFDL